MSEDKRKFFSGDTLRQALVQAANHHGLDPERIAYKSLDKKHGFLRSRHRVTIEVDPESPQHPGGIAIPIPVAKTGASPARTPGPVAAVPSESQAAPVVQAAPAPQPTAAPRPPRSESEGPRVAPRPAFEEARRELGRETVPPVAPAPLPPRSARPAEEGLIALPESPLRASERYPPATGPQAEAAEKGLELLLSIAGLDLSARVHQGDERLEVDLSGPSSERCFDDEGELLMSIEHLLPRIVRSIAGEPVLCRVDCDNYHEIREEQLRTLAQRVAEDVRRRGRPRTLEAMNPADRRIVHMTLADDPHVETESDGEGYFKRVMIRPS